MVVLRFLAPLAVLFAAVPALAVEQPACASVPGADAASPGADVGVSLQFGGAGGCADPPCFYFREGGARLNLQAFGGREFVVQPSGVLTGCLRLPEP